MHLHALRRTPRAYLTALWWRVCGKRLRARAQFAPLLATSSHAYKLWLCNEPRLVADQEDNTFPRILALVSAGQTSGALESTLRSLAQEGLTAIVVGTPKLPSPAAAVHEIDWQEAPWFMPLAAGDILAPGAAQAYRRKIRESQARVIYADDDLLDEAGQRMKVHLKPDWNRELFQYLDYVTGACVISVTAQDLKNTSPLEWPRELVDAALRSKEEPEHIHHVLHHRRSRPYPRPLPSPSIAGPLPPVSVIVPTRNRLDLLRTCLDGVASTDYPDIEVIVVDNGSDDPATLAYLDGLAPDGYRVLRHPGPFNFSALNNHAANQAKGHLLCLLNNDIEVLSPDWLKTMASQAMRQDVGAVGARLLYPDGRIQHAGVVLGIGGGAAHAHRLLQPDEEGYFHRHAIPQFVSAVTAACMLVTRERFLAVGGLDEQNFAVAFNDVDLCMRLNQRGWQSLYEPRATLIHHESVSRGFDRDPVGAARLAKELAALKRLWRTGEQVDPFHHPQLSPFSERFVIRL